MCLFRINLRLLAQDAQFHIFGHVLPKGWPPVVSLDETHCLPYPRMSDVGCIVGQSDNLSPQAYIAWNDYPPSGIVYTPCSLIPMGIWVLQLCCDFLVQRVPVLKAL
jgi:hypothetical protein